MPEQQNRQRLAALLAADAAGYSRLMAHDASATVAALDAARAVFRERIDNARGRVIDMAGDSVLAVFETAAGAVAAALAIQGDVNAVADAMPEGRRLRFRIGVHLGDVIEKADGTVYGDGVNIAARLEGLAEPGGITISDAVRGVVSGKVAASFEDQGEQLVKNIAEPVRTFRVHPIGAKPAASVTAPSPIADGSDAVHAIVDMSAPVPGFGGRPAIAVLPFTNLSGDPEQEFFADGLAEDILTLLARGRWMPVIARNSSFSYKGRAVDVKEVGLALGARYILEGSVRKSGNRVRVTGQLIDATTGHHVWAERYDRVLEDLFAIQDELTEGIVSALGSAVGRAEVERARAKPPGSLDAWEALQRGLWHHFRATREDYALALPFLVRATQLDPGLAAAHSFIAVLKLTSALFQWTDQPGLAIAEAVASARAALFADDMDAQSYSVMGMALTFSGKHDDALVACRKGVELNPSYSGGYVFLATTHYFRGEPAQAIQACETAIRISPRDTWTFITLSILAGDYCLARDFAKAAEIARLSLQANPNYPIAWRALTIALGQLGRLDEAREALAQLMKLLPGFTNEAAARAALPFRDEAVFQYYLEGLRKAGWTG